jgi:hypothetical protein
MKKSDLNGKKPDDGDCFYHVQQSNLTQIEFTGR